MIQHITSKDECVHYMCGGINSNTSKLMNYPSLFHVVIDVRIGTLPSPGYFPAIVFGIIKKITEQ